MSSEKAHRSTAKPSYRVDPVRRSEIGREKRKRNLAKLLRSTIEFLAINGFERSTIEDIATASEMSLRTFYNYFPKKQDLATAIDILLYEVAAQTDARPVPDELDLVEQVAFGMMSTLHVGVVEPAITSVSFELYLSRYPETEVFWERSSQRFRTQYAEGVKQGVFVELNESVLRDFLFTPLYFVANRLANLQRSKQPFLVKDAVVQALSVLGIPREQSKNVVAKLGSSMVVHNVNTQRAYELAIERLLG